MPEAVAVGVVVRDANGSGTATDAFRQILPAIIASDGAADNSIVLLMPDSGAAFVDKVDHDALAYVARSLDGLVDRVIVLDHGIGASVIDVQARLLDFMEWCRSERGPLVTRSSDIWSRYVVDRLRSVVSDNLALFDGRIAVLDQLDSTSRSEYVASLATLLDHGGDVPSAAAAMYLHPNTLRYRVRRIKELTGLDLDDPVDRFVAEFQVRLRFSPSL